MRRWNGWGEVDRDDSLGAAATVLLGQLVGTPTPTQDARLEDVLAAIVPSRITSTSSFQTDSETRLRHARGQSFPDWIALRFGQIGPVADAVALPTSHPEVEAAIAEAQRIGAVVVPFGGGTSVVGHLNVPVTDRPVIHLSMERMDGLLSFDEKSQLARFGAGTPGPRVESQLAPLGFLLGHFPQSYEYSTVGGWVVTRSSGQQSARYGRIEQLFAQGKVASPRGAFSVGGVPASSAGPDLREAMLGSEGRLGALTEVTVRVRPLPAREDFHAVFFPDWESGIEAVRRIVQTDVPLSMLRLSNVTETQTQLALAGHDSAILWLKRYLKLRGIGTEPVLLIFGATGFEADVNAMRRRALAVAEGFKGVHVGRAFGRGWAAKRFAGPYLRNALWAAGYGVDTVETCLNWPDATAAMNAIESAARGVFAVWGEKVHAFTHLSHVYRQGCSIYSTFVFQAAPTFAANLERWKVLKQSVSEAIVAAGGTISHQHGVGSDHAPYLPHEKGALGMDLIRAMAREMDPKGMMNPGKLFT